MTIDRDAIERQYNALHQTALDLKLDTALISKIDYWQRSWQVYLDFVVAHVPANPAGKTVLDFGCGYGLLAPVLLGLGAKSYIGIDDSEILQRSRDVFCAQAIELRTSISLSLDDARLLFAGQLVSLVEPEDGYLPVQPETADIIIANEVVSHVPKAQLPIVYDELWRVLAPGGVLYLSDGNGLDSPSYIHKTLLPLHAALENGPDGVQIGAPPFPVTVGRCYRSQREDLIRVWYPDLEASTITHVAKNTSGLHGAFLRKTVDRFVSTGYLIRRPYQRGFVPTVPTTGGVEERGFFAEQVALDLRSRGFVAAANTASVRTPAPWFETNCPSSFPDGNFCVTATKPG